MSPNGRRAWPAFVPRPVGMLLVGLVLGTHAGVCYGLPCPERSFGMYEGLDPPPVRLTVTEMDWRGFSTPFGRKTR